MSTPEKLDRMVDQVLTSTPLKVIAGTPNHPLVISEIEISCYVLEDETRVLSQGGFLQAIGRSRTPKAGTRGVDKDPSFLAAENLKPFIPSDFGVSTRPVLFQSVEGGGATFGYRAELLPRVCEVYLNARKAGALHPRQQHIAERAETLILGLATVGIIALVDEATGYERIRAERALATILERFIAKDLQPWTRTFPYTFYEQIFRLKGWGNPEGVRRPSVIGHYTNDFVYARIAPGVLDDLKRRNPTLPQGWRRDRHHQWFTPDIGHPMLKEHLEGVTALMRAAATWNGFKRALERAYPKIDSTFPMLLNDE